MQIDRREQDKLHFPLVAPITAVEDATLEVGDYAVVFEDGTQPPVRFERKSLQDLYGTFTQGYARFKREMTRAKELHLDLIVLVEADLAAVGQGVRYSRFPGPSMLQKCFTMMVRHHLPIVFCPDRLQMSRWIVGYASAVGREWVVLQTQRRRGLRALRSSEPVV